MEFYWREAMGAPDLDCLWCQQAGRYMMERLLDAFAREELTAAERTLIVYVHALSEAMEGISRR